MKIYINEKKSCNVTPKTSCNTQNTSCDAVSSSKLITNIGLSYPGTVMPLKPIVVNESNSLIGFNQLGLNEIIPCMMRVYGGAWRACIVSCTRSPCILQ